jgi:hypothetical protein
MAISEEGEIFSADDIKNTDSHMYVALRYDKEEGHFSEIWIPFLTHQIPETTS